ncbi:hypothetical protein Tco_1028120 [Tanacetum coccineum]
MKHSFVRQELVLMFDVSIFRRPDFARVWTLASSKLTYLQLGYITQLIVIELLSPTVAPNQSPNHIPPPVFPSWTLASSKTPSYLLLWWRTLIKVGELRKKKDANMAFMMYEFEMDDECVEMSISTTKCIKSKVPKKVKCFWLPILPNELGCFDYITMLVAVCGLFGSGFGIIGKVIGISNSERALHLLFVVALVQITCLALTFLRCGMNPCGEIWHINRVGSSRSKDSW